MPSRMMKEWWGSWCGDGGIRGAVSLRWRLVDGDREAGRHVDVVVRWCVVFNGGRPNPKGIDVGGAGISFLRRFDGGETSITK